MIGLKKNLAQSNTKRKTLIDSNHPHLSIARQCELLSLPRSSFYYEPVPVVPEDLALMNRIDEIYAKFPYYYGSPRMTAQLNREGRAVNHKKTGRLMRHMGIQAVYPRPNTSKSHPEHVVFPYLLKERQINHPNEVWGTDITYVRASGFWFYLVAIIDWYSRYVLAWRLSPSLSVDFCIETLREALTVGIPGIHNSDQGTQFTSMEYTGILKAHNVRISMDGRGRCFDNIFTERLWRTVKYEEVYLHEYSSYDHAHDSLGIYFRTYNHERLHQALNYRTPAEIHFNKP